MKNKLTNPDRQEQLVRVILVLNVLQTATILAIFGIMMEMNQLISRIIALLDYVIGTFKI